MYLLMLLLSLAPLEEILLETDGELFELSDLSNVQYDGSLTLVNKYMVYHLNSEGRLIRKFYGKGDGPGEFQYLFEALWDGTHYFLHDIARNDFSVFNSTGRYLGRSKLMIRDLFFFGEHLLGLDLTPFLKNDPEGKPLVELVLGKNATLTKSSKSFHFIHPVIFDWLVDRKQYFLSQSEGLLYVMTQLSREVFVYDESRKELKRFEVQLEGYVPPGEPWKRGISRSDYFKKLYSFSQVSGLVVSKGKLAISYTVPRPGEGSKPKNCIQVVNAGGKPLGSAKEVQGVVLGGHNGSYYVVREDDELRYFLKKVVF